MRLSRPCYNKAHRCPGWAGGGTRSARRYRCQDGSIRTRKPDPDYPGQFVYPSTATLRFGHCTKGCGVVTWPYATRWLDPRYLLVWKLGAAIRDVRLWWADR